MKKIQLTQGKFTLVDDDDFIELSAYKWHAHKNGNMWYAARNYTNNDGIQKKIYMHTEIMGTPKNSHTDHIDNNGLNNSKKNLRIASCSQNQYNQSISCRGTSKYKGVYQDKKSRKWKSQIGINGNRKHIGLFANEIDAAKAYDKKAKELYGEFARTNF